MAKNSQKFKPELVETPVDVLRPSDHHSREIEKGGFAHLVKSIKIHGVAQPIIANSSPARENVIINGHQVLLAAIEAGLDTVPVIFFDLTLEQEKALSLRINRIGGRFIDELLRVNFDMDFLLETGFNDADLGDIWDGALEINDDSFNEEKAVKQALSTDIKLGDMFVLGKHRLLCADSTDLAAIKRLAGDLKPSVLYVDPVFNIGLDYNKGVGGKATYGGKTGDHKSKKQYREFLGELLANALAVMTDDAHAFMFCDQNYIGLVQDLMAEHGLTNRRVCLWLKNAFNVTPGVAFNKAYEPVVYATRKKPYLSDTHNLSEILNKEISSGNRAHDDIVDLFDIWLAKRDPGQDYQHPTQKPLTLHEKPLKRCTKVGDVVLDVCGGSGSTLLSCEQLKRVALLSEIDPVFCQVIINRFEAATGQKVAKL
ncbi:MAG: DNA modification methylase [Patescibacteria group bacterium]